MDNFVRITRNSCLFYKIGKYIALNKKWKSKIREALKFSTCRNVPVCTNIYRVSHVTRVPVALKQYQRNLLYEHQHYSNVVSNMNIFYILKYCMKIYKVSTHLASTRFLLTTVTNEDVIDKKLSPRDGDNMLANATLNAKNEERRTGHGINFCRMK